MGARIWTPWDWCAEPDAPKSWTEPENRVVLVEDWLGPDPKPNTVDAWWPVARAGAVLVAVEPIASLHWLDDLQVALSGRHLPAIRIERQADLTEETHDALRKVHAAHRAFVVRPREILDLGTWFLRGAVHTDVDLVVVQGPTGPDAWPMAHEWVTAIRDQCAAAGVAFAFLGWGDFLPEQEYPSEINGCSKRRRAWMDGDCKGPRPEPVGVEGTWWGTYNPETKKHEGAVITEWGAIDYDGTYAQGWTGWRDSQKVCRVGAELAGRRLDGKEHLELPEGL